ncbi:MAG: hypothetical protein Q7U26_18400 [Aquabacterium sp.]|nr:hypothetical protein [Aquabacterium sp.]
MLIARNFECLVPFLLCINLSRTEKRMTHCLARWASMASLSILATSAAWAAPISSSLSITASVSLDTATSATPIGGATQIGTLTKVSGGTTSTSSFSGVTLGSGSNPLAGALTEVNDGVGMRFTQAGTSSGDTTDPLWADFRVDLANSSATVTFVVSFRALISNLVSASGNDAFAYADVSIFDGANNEIVFSDHRVDTANAANNLLADSADSTFSITLAPGASGFFTGVQHQRGGLGAAGAYSSDLDTFLRIEGVTSRGGPTNDVPLPGTLPLVALALAALGTARRRQTGA